jgi:hypothetical protein
LYQQDHEEPEMAGQEEPTNVDELLVKGEGRVLSRRTFLHGTLMAATATAAAPLCQAQGRATPPAVQRSNPQRADGLFDWQFPDTDKERAWKNYSFNIDPWWGDFSHDLPEQADMFADNPWAIGPFTKYASNPVLASTPGVWDQGRYGGGVHNGSVIVKNDKFYYVYRGERPIDIERPGGIDYICDIGVAVSNDTYCGSPTRCTRS